MPISHEFEATLDDYGEVASEPLRVKLQSASSEINVELSFADVAAILSGIPSGHNVRALKAGVSAGEAASWALGDKGELLILVGHDDETWDFGVFLPPTSRDGLLKQLSKFHEKAMRSNNALERTRGG